MLFLIMIFSYQINISSSLLKEGNTMKKSLYERLGSAEGIKKLANDIAENHLKNTLIKTRFEIIEDFASISIFFCVFGKNKIIVKSIFYYI